MNLGKYHGLGNDFIIGRYADFNHLDMNHVAKTLCDRHTGIGADGLILVKLEPLEMVYYNSDGSRAEMCGNGIRCFANYIYDEQIEKKLHYDVKTLAGTYHLDVYQTHPFVVEVNMKSGNYQPSAYGGTATAKVIDYPISINQETYNITSLLLGVPHTVIEVDEIDLNSILNIGPKIESHPLFNEKTNVNFVKILNARHVKLQTYERGAGLTLACGTGACATFDALYQKGVVADKITVTLPKGNLTLYLKNHDIIMRGPAQKIADITVEKTFI